ncbi:MAG: hypothetical protein ACPHRO_13300, partial [Nannocystaceae bacterium]
AVMECRMHHRMGALAIGGLLGLGWGGPAEALAAPSAEAPSADASEDRSPGGEEHSTATPNQDDVQPSDDAKAIVTPVVEGEGVVLGGADVGAAPAHDEPGAPVGAWTPPPDPLLSDSEVPAWPSSQSARERAAAPSLEERPDRPGEVGVAADTQALGDPGEASLAAQRARSWTRAGIVGVVTGSALIVGGLAMRFSDPCAFGAGNNCFVDARNRAAAAMGVPGGVILAGGIVMIIVGQTQHKRLHVSPSLSRRHAGASLRVTF